MSLRINTNVPSIRAQHQMGRTQRELESALSELATGSKFSAPNADNASHAIAEGLRAQKAGLEAANRNAEDAISFVQIADGSLNEQSNLLIRQRELAVQASSDTLSDKEREYLNKEFSQLTEEIDRIAKATTYGSTQILVGKTQNYEFQVGGNGKAESRIKFSNDADTTASNLGVDGLEVTDKSSARDALEGIDTALQQISSVRAQFGSVQSRLQYATSFIGTHLEAITESHSRLADVDVAEAVSKARKAQILQQYQAAALAQANQLPDVAVRLVG